MKGRSVSFLRWIYFKLQYLLFHLLARIVTSLSPSAAASLAEGIGSLLFLRKRRREISLRNIRSAFPEKSDQEVMRIGRGSMQGLVKVIFEFVRIPHIAKNPERYIEIQGEDHVSRALEGGKGLILVVSHFGNWELMGIAAAAKGWPMHAIGKPTKNPFLYNYIKELRGATGLQTIHQEGAVRSTIRVLKKNQIVAMLIDEHAKEGGIWVDFFAKKAATSSLPAMLALKYRAPVIPTFYYRNCESRSVLFFGPPFELIHTGNYDSDLLSNTQQYVRRLEKEILQRPEDWTLWMHNRWRDN